MGLIDDVRALRRSWRIYHGEPAHNRALDALYARFVKPGDLVFDVGAHVGHRTASFLRLGARVVAVEPQAMAAALIASVWGWRGARVVRAACGASEGVATMHVNSANPIVTTLSSGFIEASRGAQGWEGQAWDKRASVRVTTLDALIARYGVPAFVKLDVEGFELEALAGLSQAPPALSFEFTTIQRDAAQACLARCEALGFRRFTAVIGETHQLVFDAPVDAPALSQWLAALPHEANSGDVYALRDAG